MVECESDKLMVVVSQAKEAGEILCVFLSDEGRILRLGRGWLQGRLLSRTCERSGEYLFLKIEGAIVIEEG
jgi:hypothetical protein